MSEPPSQQSFGPNAWLVDEMHERYLSDPEAVSPSWQEFFADYQKGGNATPPAAALTPAPAP
ncbi:MAG: 2-oxoglutarate dehydrogenase subunit, partial [Actinomycetia bacterium]|nr:2-oxoglutarate dehydrogenase subunit [Actinomycetes bacterium]